MIPFIILATVMLALPLYLVLPILFRRQDTAVLVGDLSARDTLNLAVLRDQLSELELDFKNQTIAAQDYQNAKRELEQRVTQELHENVAATISSPRWIAYATALVFPIVAVLLYAAVGNPTGLQASPSQATLAKQGPAAPTPQQINDMVVNLARKLQNNPEDIDGWRMLARSYETLRRFDLAVGAYQHLQKLLPNDADILNDYAVTLAMSLDQTLNGEPEKLINRALEINPNNIQSLALSGSAAFERKDYAKAILRWQKILTMVPTDSAMAQSIANNIAKAKQLEKQP